MPPLPATRKTTLIVLIGLAVVFVLLTLVLLSPFLTPIFFAIVLAIAFSPLYQSVHAKVKNPSLASLTTVFMIFLLVLLPMVLVAANVVREGRHLYQGVSEASVQEGGWMALLSSYVDAPVAWIAERTGAAAPSIKNILAARVQNMTESMGRWVGSLAGNFAATLGRFVIMLFTLFFVFREGTDFRDSILAWLPLPARRVDALLKAVTNAIIANVYGIAAVGIAQGILTGIGFLMTGLPSSLLWGMIAAFASLIPLVGAALVWVPGAIVLFAGGAWVKGLILLAWGVLVVSMSDNIIRPLVLSGRSNLNTLPIFFALLGGVQLFGFAGLFAGPVIFSVTASLLKILREELEEEAQEPVVS